MLLRDSIEYAINAPYFWSSIGFTIATAMFVGAAIYDGHLDHVKKALVSVLSYALLVFWVTYSRVASIISVPDYELHPERPIGSLVALIVVTSAWVIGVFLGVLVFTYHRYKLRKV